MGEVAGMTPDFPADPLQDDVVLVGEGHRHLLNLNSHRHPELPEDPSHDSQGPAGTFKERDTPRPARIMLLFSASAGERNDAYLLIAIL